MSTTPYIITRMITGLPYAEAKGSPLVNEELDANFIELANRKLETDKNLSDLNNVASARSNLGLGDLATKNSLDWLDIVNKPNNFPPESHNHSADDINAGTLPLNRGGTGRQDGRSPRWITARKLKIGNSEKTVSGDSDVTWTLSEIGALSGVNLSRTETTTQITINNTGGDGVVLRGATTGRAGLVTTQDQTWSGEKTAPDFIATSDIRLKENIIPLDPKDCLDKIVQLVPSSFIWKNTQEQDTGLIAQQVQEILPERVKGEEHLAISYAKLTTHIIGAIQSLIDRIEKLEQKMR